mgnify:CR=1 FL=1
MVPPVGATLGPEGGGSSELAHGNHEGVFEEAAFLEIRDEGGDDMVEDREQRAQPVPDATVGRDVIAVGIPCA